MLAIYKRTTDRDATVAEIAERRATIEAELPEVSSAATHY